MEEYRALPLTRRLEIRGRLAFAEPMTDPDEARIAARLARRQERQVLVLQIAFAVALLVSIIVRGQMPWTFIIVWIAAGPSQIIGLRRAADRNEAVAARAASGIAEP